MESKSRKKWLTLIPILCIGLLACLTGCGEDQEDVTPEPEPVSDELAGAAFVHPDQLMIIEKGVTEVKIPFLTNLEWTVECKGTPLTFTTETTGSGNSFVSVQLPEGNTPVLSFLQFTFTNALTKSTTLTLNKTIFRRTGQLGVRPEDGEIMSAIGWGINLFDKLDASNTKGQLIDYDRLLSEQLVYTNPEMKLTYKNAEGSSYQYMSEAFSNSLNLNISPKILFGLIPAPFQASVESYVTSSSVTKDYYEWAMSGFVVQKATYQIAESVLPGDGGNDWFSDEEVARVMEYAYGTTLVVVNNCGTDTAKMAALFSTYGTHMITAGVFGGRYLNIVGRKKSEYESSISSTSTAALNAKISLNKITSIGVDVTDTYTENDSISAIETLDFDEYNLEGGSSLSNDKINEWLASLDDRNNQAFISLLTSATNPYKGLLPIWAFCALESDRKAMMNYFRDYYSKRYIKNLGNPKRVIADVVAVYYTDDEYKAETQNGKNPENLDYLYMKCDLYNSKRNFSYKRISDDIITSKYITATQKGNKYIYVAWGYEDEVGLEEVCIVAEKEAEKYKANGWKLRGANAKEGVTGVVNDNRIGVKLRKSKADVTAVGFWQGKKADSTKEWRFTSVDDVSDYTWTNGQGIDWYDGAGLVHDKIWVSYATNVVNQ